MFDIFFKVCNNFPIYLKGRNYWNFSTIVTWFNMRCNMRFGSGLWAIQFHWWVIKTPFFPILYHFRQFCCFIFLPLFKYCWNVLFLDFVLNLTSSLIHGESLSFIVMTLFLTKLEKILNSVSFSIFTCFSTLALENTHRSCLKSFGLCLNWHCIVCNLKQVFGKVGDILFAG